MWYIICDGRVITCTQTIANMVVVDDRAMTNVHVVDNRSPWPINGGYMQSFHRVWFVNNSLHVTPTLDTEN